MEKKYDVFISYSRKDYEKDDQVISDNPISAIKEMFDKNGVSYWIDKKGIYGGLAFVEEISDAIAASKILVFVSSKHSNESIYTCGEILDAIDRGMLIIPVKIDDSPYNKKYKLVLRPFDFIDYKAKPNTALPELLRAINEEKAKLAEKEEETTKQQRIEAAKAEIKEKAEKYRALAGQIDFVTKELYSKSKLIGVKTKKCPVCKKVVPIQSAYCNQCSWQFPKHYGIEGFDNILEDDDAQMLLAQQIWQSHKSADEYIRFVQNDKFGFKDRQTGEIVIPCKWFFAGGFQEGLAFVKDDNGKHGFIDITGNEVIPCKWKGASDFCEGLAAVKGDNGKYGFIDKTGKEAIPCKWNGAWDFCEDLARVKDDNEKYGFIDKTGKVVIPCEWTFAENFRKGLARIKGGEKYSFIDGFIDKTGNIVRSY